MSAPDEPADRDARLALAVVDGETSDEMVAAAEDQPGLTAQLERVHEIVAALGSLSASETAATAAPVSKWGPFIVNEQVGRGSFGVVCRAFDPAVAREIAIKLYEGRELPPEPRLMARVRHPNVVTVFGAAVHEDRPGIWMEYVRGTTLADRVRNHGPLPPAEAVRIGIELCNALEAVHDAHLVHGDVKARNVMEKDDGGILLMDFGAGAARSARGQAASRITGTPLYMAPEVVRGGAASAQSDLYSLGVLLHYLLTGTYPLTAASWEELRTLLSGQTPSVAQVAARLRAFRPDVSPSLARAVAKALSPATRRYRTASELRLALEKASTERRGWFPLAWQVRRSWPTISALAVIVAMMAVWAARSRPVPRTMFLKRLTWDVGLTTDPTRSADGTLLAYASDRSGDGNLDIWVQRVPGGAPVRLTNHRLDDAQPSFSPDGSHIAFRSERDGGGLYIVPTLGGAARLIAPGGRIPRFSPDGSRIAYFGGKGIGTLFVAPVNGGPVQRPKIKAIASPAVWSPDGRHLLLIGVGADAAPDWYVVSMQAEGGSAPEPVQTGAFAALARHGLETVTAWAIPWQWIGSRILFYGSLGDTTNLWEVDIAARSFKVDGAPRRLTLSTEDQLQPSMAPDGSLVFSTRAEIPYLWELRLDGDRESEGATPRPVMPHYPGRGFHDMSADGRWLSYTSSLPGHAGISLRDLATGVETPLTTASVALLEKFPVISRDGTHVLYGAVENGERTLRRVSVKGGIPETISRDCGPPTDWSPDVRYALVQLGVPARASLAVLDLTSGRRVEILRHDAKQLYRGNFSPDGRWIAFHAGQDSGWTQEFVAPFHALTPIPESEWIAVTDGQTWTDAPRWSPDGRTLYYISDADGFRCVWGQALDPNTKIPAGEPFVAHHVHGRKHSIANIAMRDVELSVAPGKILYSMGELRGNIWLAEFR
jgi:serine/threonine protein kinase/Tol biopolymer transport system component